MNIINLTIKEIYYLLKNRQIKSYDLTLSCIQKIKKYNNKIGAFLFFENKKSLINATISDNRYNKGRQLSCLDGIPVSIKDIVITKNIKTTASSKILNKYIPVFESTIITKLKKSGAIIIGKTNCDEFSMGSSNENSSYFICKNPHNLNYSPGGSSGGSAASISSGMSLASIGTDTGGSVRQPASFCGLIGIKPTYGKISRCGIIAFSSSLDQVGIFSKTTYDASIILSILSNFDKKDTTSNNRKKINHTFYLNYQLKNIKFGIPKEYFYQKINAFIRIAINKSILKLKKINVNIKRISIPSIKYNVSTYHIITTAEASSNLYRYDGIRFGLKLGRNLNETYRKTRSELFGKEVKKRIMLGNYILNKSHYDLYYQKSLCAKKLIKNDFKKTFSQIDVLISPTIPIMFKSGIQTNNPTNIYLSDIFTVGTNLSGLCAISIPSSYKKIPIGFQLIGKPLDENLLMSISSFLENHQ